MEFYQQKKLTKTLEFLLPYLKSEFTGLSRPTIPTISLGQ
jgi:hypothetical protein